MSQAIISSGDPAEILDPPEHSLDGIAVAVEVRREAVFPAPIGFGRDVRGGALTFDFPPHRVAVVSLVAVQDGGFRQLVEQGVGRGTVGDLAAGQHKGDRTAEIVGQCVDFGCASASRSADRLVELPPFPPEALRCALTAEESIMSCAGGPPEEAKA